MRWDIMKHTKINKRVIIIALGIDILLILAATIALYIQLMRPFYCWTETGSFFTAIDTVKGQWLWLTLPAI